MLFGTTISVCISEFEFTTYHLVEADSFEQADEKVKEHCRGMYEGEVEETCNGFEFGVGYPIVTYFVGTETTIESWAKEMARVRTI